MGVDEKALGQRLQKARQRAGLTQQQLCQKAGLSYSTLAKIERGAIKAPSVFTVATISQTTGVTLEELLDLKNLASATNPAKRTSKTGVKFVYFDLNRTLVKGYEKAFTEVAAQAGLSADKVEMIYWRYNAAANNGELTMSDFNKIMSQQLGLPGFDWPSYYLHNVEPVEGITELVKWVAEHYQVGILSGTMPGLIKALTSSGKLPAVQYDQIVDSSEVKLLKNTPQIFELAQQKTGLAPNELLLVDDDVQAVMLADQLGWQISRFDTYNPAESIVRIKQHLEF